MSTIRLVDTGDGSHSLRNDALNENYHSWHGAVTESRYVFIEAGLQEAYRHYQQVRILEVGHGTGLNAALSLGYAREKNRELRYAGLEPWPVPSALLHSINYPAYLSEYEKEAFLHMIDAAWDEPQQWNDSCAYIKIKQGIQQAFIQQVPAGWQPFNLVYYDAFGPEKQSEMWEKQVWQTCYELLDTNGIIVTYCAKGQVKRDLKEAGFLVETLPGPPGKREMIRARKRSL